MKKNQMIIAAIAAIAAWFVWQKMGKKTVSVGTGGGGGTVTTAPTTGMRMVS